MLYTSILQSSSIIADYSEEIGDFSMMVSTILRANRQAITFYVIPYLGQDYYFLHHENLTFTSITQANLDNEKVLIYLQKLKAQFIPLYKSEKNKLTFRSISLIKQLMTEFKDQFSENKFKKVDDKLEMIMKEKQEQMKATLEKDSLLNKTKEKSDTLMINSIEMHNAIKRKAEMNKRRYRIYYYIGFVIVISIVLYLYFNYYHWTKK